MRTPAGHADAEDGATSWRRHVKDEMCEKLSLVKPVADCMKGRPNESFTPNRWPRKHYFSLMSDSGEAGWPKVP